jgi:hypothetical protein
MAFAQVAKLYLRGSINQQLRNLTEQQRNELDKIVDFVFRDPYLAQCRIEFCNALARTIRNEYQDREIGEQDYRIAIMRAAIAAIYGWADKPPALKALDDPIQRKKWFQTWAFNYLRQILRENRLPAVRKSNSVRLEADEAAIWEIKIILAEVIETVHDFNYKRTLKKILENLQVNKTDIGYDIVFDHWSFPALLMEKIRELSITYLKHQIEIVQTLDGIRIKCLEESLPYVTVKQITETPIHPHSLDSSSDEDEGKDKLEMNAILHRPHKVGLEEEEMLTQLRQRLPNDALPVLDIFMEECRPQSYIEQYGNTAPRISYIAKFLSKSPREVKRLLSIIRIHCIALRY